TTQQTVAGKLGLAPEDTAHLRELLLDSDTLLTEDALETLFGLGGTQLSPNPLSDGLTRNDVKKQITRWNLEGADPGNTDANGILYLRVHRDNTLRLFRDAQQHQPVASGQTTDGVVNLVAENGSGLSGRIELAATGQSNVQLQAIPRLLAWRGKQQVEIWKAA